MKNFLLVIFIILFQVSLFSDANSNQMLILNAKSNNIDGIKKAIKTGVSEKGLNTALFWAINYSKYEAVEILLDNDANVNYKTNGTPILIEALKKNNKDIVWLLIKKKADINVKADNGYTPLLIASWYGKKEFVEYFIKNNAEINIKDKSTGYTPLLLLAGRGYCDLVALMIKYKANVDEQDNKGYTSLMKAAKNGQLEEVQILVKSGANINIKSIDGYTALSLARSFKNIDIYNFLKKLNAVEGKTFNLNQKQI